MKNQFKINFAIIACILIASPLFGQTQEFDVKGLKVIYKSVPKEIVSARLFIQGGTANYSLEQSGIEDFALQLAVTGGTKSKNKLEFSTALEKMSTTIAAGTNYDYGQISLRCVKQNWDQSWDLFADAILNPAFEEQQFQLLKDQLIAAAKQNETDPDQSLLQEAMTNVFKGQNYEKNPNGSEETLSKLTLEELKNYYKNLVGNSFKSIIKLPFNI